MKSSSQPLPLKLAQLRLKHLSLLDQIAVHGSLRQVADQLHVTQPAVTAMLKDLESAFGADLVKRDRHGAALTERGHAARARLAAILNELRGVELANSLAANGRLLRVGALPTAMMGLASRAMAELRRRDSGLSVRLVEQTVESVLADLHSHKLDCAISRVDAETLAEYPHDAFHFDPLLRMQMRIACRRGHPLMRKRSITLATLANYSWATLAVDSQVRIAFEQAFVLDGLRPPIPMVESLSFVSNLNLVRNTDLLTIAPDSAIEEFHELGIVERVDFVWPVPVSPLMLITRRDAGKLSDMDEFRAVLHHCAQQLLKAAAAGAGSRAGRKRGGATG